MTPEFKKACRKAKALTADNYHTEALLALANSLKSQDGLALQSKLVKLVKDHDKAGELTPDIASRRKLFAAKLDELIIKEFGLAARSHANRSL